MAEILITGANGQLGNELRRVGFGGSFNVRYTDADQLDITDKDAVTSFLAENKVDYIINCAAYTAVDNAEDNIEAAYNVNSDAPRILAEAAFDSGALLIHVSTDYVFNGTGPRPYSESDYPDPLGIYGKSKLAGERAIEKSGCDFVIIRTAWLYSEFGNNFVKTILKYSAERENLNVVFDQTGTPTYAADLADLIIKIVDGMESGSYSREEHCGLYHYTNEGVCSWFDFAREIVKLSGRSTCKVSPVTSEMYPVKAPRPAYSVLDKSKTREKFGVEIPYWRESLKKCINRLTAITN